MKGKNKGFTLIETLAVLGITSILLLVVLLGLSNARKKARDRKRIADMQQFQLALDLYREKNGFYPGPCSPNPVPITGEVVAPGSNVALELRPYLDPVPTDPLYSQDPANYYYAYDPWHNRDVGPATTVIGIRKFEVTMTPDRQTSSGGDQQLNVADWNRTLSEGGYGDGGGVCPPP